MTPGLSLFVLSPLCVHAVAANTTTAAHGSSASEFSDRAPAGAFPQGAGNFSNIGASTSYQLDQASRFIKRDALTRIRRTAFDARSTRNGYSLPQVNLSQTSAAMFAPYSGKLSYLLRP